MSKFFKFRATVTAISLAAGALMGGSAQAYTYAVSSLQIKDLAVTISNVDDRLTGYSFKATADADFKGSQASSSLCGGTLAFTTCSTGTPTLDAAVTNGTGSTLVRVENNFGFLGTSGAASGKSYASADSQITTSEIMTVPSTTTSTKEIAEALLNENGTAASNSKQSSSTGLNLRLSVVAPGSSLSLVFNADADMMLQTTLPESNFAQADINATFTLTRTSTGGGSISWSPVGTGTGTNECVVSGLGSAACVETADGESLNRTMSTFDTPNTVTNSSFTTAADWSAFGINITKLPVGDYTLTFASGVGTQLFRQADVPEPGSLALIGVALAGLGFAARRRKA